MKAQTIDIQQCTGRILSSAIFRPGGKKLLAKGHILREEDIRILQLEGMDHIWVAELDEDEVSEDDAVCGIAAEMACGSYEIQLAPGGRANLIATENCCVLVDEELLRQVNCTSGLVIATTLNFSFAVAGQRIATVKSAPFAVSKSDFEGSRNMLRERGPIMQARPARGASIAVLYCDPINGDRARKPYLNLYYVRNSNVSVFARRTAWRFLRMKSTYRVVFSNCCARNPRLCWWLRPLRPPGQTTLWAARWKRSVVRSNASWRPLSQGISC